jgi:hypothetical protein
VEAASGLNDWFVRFHCTKIDPKDMGKAEIKGTHLTHSEVVPVRSINTDGSGMEVHPGCGIRSAPSLIFQSRPA